MRSTSDGTKTKSCQGLLTLDSSIHSNTNRIDVYARDEIESSVYRG